MVTLFCIDAINTDDSWLGGSVYCWDMLGCAGPGWASVEPFTRTFNEFVRT